MAQLPNLETFTLDTAQVTHVPGSLRGDLIESLVLYSGIIAFIAARIRDGIYPGATEMTALKKRTRYSSS